MYSGKMKMKLWIYVLGNTRNHATNNISNSHNLTFWLFFFSDLASCKMVKHSAPCIHVHSLYLYTRYPVTKLFLYMYMVKWLTG